MMTVNLIEPIAWLAHDEAALDGRTVSIQYHARYGHELWMADERDDPPAYRHVCTVLGYPEARAAAERILREASK